MYIYIRRPLLVRGHQAGREAVSNHLSPISYIQSAVDNLYQFSMINQQLTNQLLINLLIAGLQVSELVLSTVLLHPPG